MYLHNDMIYNSGAPSVAGRLGQFYVNTDNGGDMYQTLKDGGGLLVWVNITNQSGNDPVTANTKLLLHFNGAGATFTDSSPSAWALAVGVGSPTQSAGTKKFGAASLDLTGGSDGVIVTASSGHADFDFGAGDWTVEGWVNLSTFGATPMLVDAKGNAGGNGWAVGTSAATGFLFLEYSHSGGTDVTLTGSVVAPSTGVWAHVAFERYNNVLYGYVNGVVENIGALAQTIDTTAQDVFIGSNGAASQFLDGFVDEVRVDKGVARYQGTTFTPPTSEY